MAERKEWETILFKFEDKLMKMEVVGVKEELIRVSVARLQVARWRETREINTVMVWMVWNDRELV